MHAHHSVCILHTETIRTLLQSLKLTQESIDKLHNVSCSRYVGMQPLFLHRHIDSAILLFYLDANKENALFHLCYYHVGKMQFLEYSYYSTTHSSAPSEGSHISSALDRLPANPLQVWLTGLEQDDLCTPSSSS